MKYIKVKEPYENNTIIMKVHHEEKDCYVCESNTSNIWLRASKGWVIARANTIEELCDEFVGVDNNCENGHQLLKAIPYKCANFWNGGVYGAVWTNKGLIYVAQMNNKGELELI